MSKKPETAKIERCENIFCIALGDMLPNHAPRLIEDGSKTMPQYRVRCGCGNATRLFDHPNAAIYSWNHWPHKNRTKKK
jgi:hypothetical protein